MLHIVGECDRRIFGLTPAERLERQARGLGDLALVADASAVIDDATLGWLAGNEGTIIASASGRPLAVVVAAERSAAAADALAGEDRGFAVERPTGRQFVRKLRRRVELGAHSLLDEPEAAIERRLFDQAYKGVTDVVTKYAWPWPAFHVTRACARLGISPNAVTWAGLVLVLLAGWLFYGGELAAGLAAAWAMTFLDTVDGKLARVTVTSSAFGNLLDHGTDILHPPVWWFCLANGLAQLEPARSAAIWTALWVILGCYVAGRAVEIGFHRGFGFNAYIWKPFDSAFRLVVSRRNIILLAMTAGLILGAPVGAFLLSAAWSVVSTIVQLVRIGQAFAQRRSGTVSSWLA